jgi:hypothetical protein
MTATRCLLIPVVVLVLVESLSPQMAAIPPEQTASAPPAQWALSANISGYIVPNDRSYASPTFTADRGWVHLGARYNDEDKQTGSLWVGYNFEVGDTVALSATPMIGGVFGNTTGVAPGYLAALTWKRLELSTEGEYVFDTRDRAGSFFYSWMELSYSPVEWFRTGLVAQRTKAYHTDLDVQRGVLIGFSHKKMDFTTYVFNAGWTDPTVVLSLGVHF